MARLKRYLRNQQVPATTPNAEFSVVPTSESAPTDIISFEGNEEDTARLREYFRSEVQGRFHRVAVTSDPQIVNTRPEHISLPKEFWSTEPYNFEAAKQAILSLYKLKWLRDPEHILEASSPRAAMMLALYSSWLVESHPIAHQFTNQLTPTHESTAIILRECERSITVDFNEYANSYAAGIVAKGLRLKLNGEVDPSTKISEEVVKELAVTFQKQLSELSVNEEDVRGILVEHLKKAICYGQNSLDLENPTKIGQGQFLGQLLTTIAENAGWWFAFDKAVIICDRPKLFNHDPEGRLHSTRQAAVEYRDGWKIFAYHGLVVPERIIMQPETITIPEIKGAQNIEMRRILIDQYGLQQYLKDVGAKMVHKDEYGELWQEQIASTSIRRRIQEVPLMGTLAPAIISGGTEINFDPDEPVTMLHCFDKSSNREYWIRVPPTMRTAREASAWTFNQNPEDYKPIKET